MKIISNLSEANGMKVQITDKRFSLKKKMPKTTYYWLTSCENGQILKLLICNALSSTQYSLPMSSTSFAVLLSALPHCRIFSKSTGTCEWLTCILNILQCRKIFFKRKKNGVETVKPKFPMDTLNNNAKSCQKFPEGVFLSRWQGKCLYY